MELTAAAQLLGIELPDPTDPLAVVSIDQAPELVLEVVGFEPSEFQDNDIEKQSRRSAERIEVSG